ncbi:MAG: ribbon-helix-helix protein, CopG family [Candidatus Dormibacteria bacterium]
MVRTQVQLTERQIATLQQRAAERHVSIALIVREAVDRHLEEEDRAALHERARSAVGRFRSDGANVSQEHDRFLEDAFSA